MKGLSSFVKKIKISHRLDSLSLASAAVANANTSKGQTETDRALASLTRNPLHRRSMITARLFMFLVPTPLYATLAN
jgi:hypothetical protein